LWILVKCFEAHTHGNQFLIKLANQYSVKLRVKLCALRGFLFLGLLYMWKNTVYHQIKMKVDILFCRSIINIINRDEDS